MLGLGWDELLRRWDADWHAHAPGAGDEPGWLGAPPASGDDVAAAEARLRVRFPPSYREFLAVSDGWRRTGTWVEGLRPVRDVGWFRDLERDWYEIWRDIDDDNPDVALMARAIVVSAPGEDALLLDPARVDAATGEWHVCTFSNKHPGAAAGSMSFRDEVERLYLTFVRFDVPDGETRADLARQADDALRRAHAGDPSGLAFVAPYDWRAQCAEVQVALLERRWPSVPLLWSGTPTMPAEQALADPVVLREMVPSWVAVSREQGYNLDYELTRTPEPVLGALREAMAAVDGHRLVADFGYAPEFAAAVEEARALLPDDEEGAWRRIVAALPRWRPMAAHHVVPMGLFHDRDLGRLLRPPGQAWHRRRDELLTTPRGTGA